MNRRIERIYRWAWQQNNSYSWSAPLPTSMHPVRFFFSFFIEVIDAVGGWFRDDFGYTWVGRMFRRVRVFAFMVVAMLFGFAPTLNFWREWFRADWGITDMLDDFTMLKSWGLPVYNFSLVIVAGLLFPWHPKIAIGVGILDVLDIAVRLIRRQAWWQRFAARRVVINAE